MPQTDPQIPGDGLTSPVSIADGGTGATTAAGARAALGLGEGSRSYFFSSASVGAGVYYVAGFYDAPASDVTLTQASPTVLYGSTDNPYWAHAFIVFGGAGTASGGAGAVEIEVSGTSITEAGVRTVGDTEVVSTDITLGVVDIYAETSKKWIGPVTYTLKNAAGSTQTAFSVTFNYGLAAYEDWQNRDFSVIAFELSGLAGANDSSFNIELVHHDPDFWSYSPGVFKPGGDVLVDFAAITSTENILHSGDYLRAKLTGLDHPVSGSTDEGIVIRITTGAASSVDFLNIAIAGEF